MEGDEHLLLVADVDGDTNSSGVGKLLLGSNEIGSGRPFERKQMNNNLFI